MYIVTVFVFATPAIWNFISVHIRWTLSEGSMDVHVENHLHVLHTLLLLINSLTDGFRSNAGGI